MKFSEQWLREWVNPHISTAELAAQLTMAGLEISSITPVAADFTGVVVGEILDAKQHPNAERLKICTVKISPQESLTIVCGAKNARSGLKVAVAKVGAVLPNGLKIKKAKLRGVDSGGMICSVSELGLEKTSEGIMELPKNASVGKELRQYLKLDDNCFEVELTPNRGDALSIAGIAREVAAINKCKINMPRFKKTSAHLKDKFPIHITAKAACPHYVGCIIKDIDPKAQTPMWMQERLRRSSINTISPIVDVANYVMLELGQPLHAFDLTKLNTNIQVRYASANETIILLDGREVKLNEQTLVIADHKKVLAIAGVMGGFDSGVDNNTHDIFLESAFFNPIEIGRCARYYGLHTDSSHRFERGVDPGIQIKALERAAELLLKIAGGKAGSINEVKNEKFIPKKSPINLRKSQIKRIVGISIANKEVKNILQRLGMRVNIAKNGWLVTAPTFRFDINQEIDLIEEITRVYGYNNIPSCKLKLELEITPVTETKLSFSRIHSCLVDKGYNEVITYSFVDPDLQKLLYPDNEPIELQNPISQDLSVMRASLWPGLIQAALYNYHRQQTRIRLFETGLCFTKQGQAINQRPFLGGIATGSAYPEQWGIPNRDIDIFDIKADLQFLLGEANFVKASHSMLHPGRAAKICHNDKIIGFIGELHPAIKSKLGINLPICLFELDLAYIQSRSIPKFTVFSKFPIMRRDIAIVINEHISAQQLIEKILVISNELLCNVKIFDIYKGEHIEKGNKSIALNLRFQHFSRTLVDEEVDAQVEKIVKHLKQQFNAELRR